MPWPANGDYYGFKEDAIKSYAPPVSGVYGIYNFNHHILIGHSNNIREALLSHHRETNFRFRRLQPTGFTFEICSTEAKEFRAQELIWEYDPLLQVDGNISLKAWWRSWSTPRSRAFFHSAAGTVKPSSSAAPKLITTTIMPEKPQAERARPRRDEFAMLTSGIAFAVVAIALYVLLGENKTIAVNWTKQLLAFAQGITSSPVDNARTASVVPQNSPSATSASASDAPLESVNELQANTNVDPPQPVDSVAAALKTDDFAKPGADSVKSVDTPLPSSGGESSSTLNKPSSRPAWTVQALATTDRQDAKNWLDRLKTKGYDAYIVEAEIRGLSWYRIRVGNLATRQEAEELSKTLRTQEGFRDAFIAGSVKTDILMAASSRLPQLRPKH